MDGRNLDASRKRSLANVRRAIAAVKRVIAGNMLLRQQHPEYSDRAEQRMIEGEAELATLTEEERRLR